MLKNLLLLSLTAASALSVASETFDRVYPDLGSQSSREDSRQNRGQNQNSFHDYELDTYAALYEFTVFSKTFIESKSSDILGNVGAGSNITLENFYIDGVLWSASDISLHKVKVRSELVAPRFSRLDKSAYQNLRRANPFHHGLLAQHKSSMDRLSQRLANLDQNLLASMDGSTLSFEVQNPSATTQSITLDSKDFENIDNIYFNGPRHAVYIINILGNNIDIEYLGIIGLADPKTKVRLAPNQIIWNFPEAQKLRMARSGSGELYQTQTRSHGTQNLGLPGYVIAPYADATLSDMAITGGVHAKSIKSSSNCSAPGAQINGYFPPQWDRILEGNYKK